jgi:hypothetical protein
MARMVEVSMSLARSLTTAEVADRLMALLPGVLLLLGCCRVFSIGEAESIGIVRKFAETRHGRCIVKELWRD